MQHSATESAQYETIERHEMPVGSFKYGQLASFDGVDAPTDAWLVCLPCSKPKNAADNGKSGFDTVLVVHFICSREDDARRTAASLANGHSVTLVAPVAS
jgi:hypothetical protein